MIYNIELYVNGTFELSTYGIDDKDAESLKGFTETDDIEEAEKFAEDENYSEDIIRVADRDIEEGDFELKVTDENGNEVWSTDDPNFILSCPVHKYCDSYLYEDDGYYIVKLAGFHHQRLVGQIETDVFAPSKLAIDSPSCYDDLLGEDIINLDYLCYDGERIYFEIEYVWQYNGEYHLNQIINGKWQAPFDHNVRYDLPSEEMDEDTWTDD